MIETECPWFWKKILHASCYSQAPACNGTDLLVRQYLSKQSAHLAENLNQVASYSRLLIVKGGSMKI